MRDMLAPFGVLSDWARFADSWNDLEIDTYMADGGRYRRRRHAVYQATRRRRAARGSPGALSSARLQSAERRRRALVRADRRRCGRRRDDAHHPRLLPRVFRQRGGRRAPGTSRSISFGLKRVSGKTGLPTPEGLHRDGVDYVLVVLVQRRNIARGTTSIHGSGGQPPRRVHAHRAARRRVAGRRAGRPRGYGGAADRSVDAGVSGRAGGDFRSFPPSCLSRSSSFRAHTYSPASSARPSAIVNHPGPGRTSSATPIASNVKPNTILTSRFT